MATRPKTPEEHSFNEHIYQYMNCHKFEAIDFDTSDEVQQLFQIYMEDIKNSEKPSNKRLDKALKEFHIPQHSLAGNGKTFNSVRDANNILNLFKTTHLSVALEINDRKYRNLTPKVEWRDDRYYIRDNKDEEIVFKPLLILNDEEMIEAKEIWDKIQNWHNYCLAANIVKVFVLNMFPTFNSLSSKQKEEPKAKLEVFITQLKHTTIYEKTIDDMLDIIQNSKHSLIQPKKIKVQRLLDLNLPRITERKTALKIVEHMIPPYL